jgi:hypothetical protein
MELVHNKTPEIDVQFLNKNLIKKLAVPKGK